MAMKAKAKTKLPPRPKTPLCDGYRKLCSEANFDRGYYTSPLECIIDGEYLEDPTDLYLPTKKSKEVASKAFQAMREDYTRYTGLEAYLTKNGKAMMQELKAVEKWEIATHPKCITCGRPTY